MGLLSSNGGASEPLWTLTNTADDATGPILRFANDKGGAGADGDDCGSIEFLADDSGQTQTTFAKILAEVSETDNTDEAGKLSLFVAESDGTTTTLTAGLILEGEHATDGEVDVTIAAGAASLTTVAGTLTVTGAATLSTIAACGSDVDKFLVSDSGVLKFRTGAEVASDIGAVSTGSTGTFTADQTFNDNVKVTLGTGGDADLYYDGTDVILNPVVVGSGDFVISGASIEFDDDEGVTLGTGKDATIQYDGTNMVINPKAVGSGYLQVSGDVVVTSSSASEPVLHITNTHAGATSGELRFNKDSASGADSDVMGLISFYGTDDSDNTHERLAYIDSYIVEATEGTEAAGLRFYVAENDATLTAGLSIVGQASADGEVDVTIAAGAASTTTVSGLMTVTGAATFTAAATFNGAVTLGNATGDDITITGYVASNILPKTDDNYDLGSSAKRWQNIYTTDLHLNNDRGNWTIVEEEDMLTIRNNKTGKWYMMGMTEIDPTGRDDGMAGPPPALP